MPRYRFDEFVFDSSDGRLSREGAGETVTLRPQVGRLLVALLEAPRRVIGREPLCRAVWGEKAVVDFESGLAAIVHELRQALARLGGPADLLETIPRRGYRLNADVAPASDSASALERRARADNDPGADPEARPVKQPPPGSSGSRRRLGWAAAAGLLLLVLALAAWWVRPTPLPPPATELALAVLPFEHFDGEPENGRRTGLLLADRLLAALWQAELQDVVLIGRVSLLPYQGRADVASVVADKLGVQLLMEGSIVGDEKQWQVSARLLRMPGGRVLWSETLHWNEAPEMPIRASVGRLVERLEQAWATGLRERALQIPES